jgi:hypothetical protein
MDAPSLPSRPVSSPPQHWTIPVSREETLTVREKFRAVSWRQPNHKPNTTKIVAWTKSVWGRYVTLDDLRHPSLTCPGSAEAPGRASMVPGGAKSVLGTP